MLTNIGIHFFDLLGWLFGPVRQNVVHLREAARAAGLLQFDARGCAGICRPTAATCRSSRSPARRRPTAPSRLTARRSNSPKDSPICTPGLSTGAGGTRLRHRRCASVDRADQPDPQRQGSPRARGVAPLAHTKGPVMTRYRHVSSRSLQTGVVGLVAVAISSAAIPAAAQARQGTYSFRTWPALPRMAATMAWGRRRDSTDRAASRLTAPGPSTLRTRPIARSARSPAPRRSPRWPVPRAARQCGWCRTGGPIQHPPRHRRRCRWNRLRRRHLQPFDPNDRAGRHSPDPGRTGGRLG